MSAKKGKGLESINCPYCTYATKRHTTFSRHVEVDHGVTLKDVWDDVNGGPVMCRCGCGSEPTFLGWTKGYATFIVGHNAKIYDSYDDGEAKRLSATRGTNWKNRPSWCKGLTKETDNRIAERSIKSSETIRQQFNSGREAWNKSLTIETDDRVGAYAATLSEEHAKGRIKQWHSGKTKFADERLKTKGEMLSSRYNAKEIKTWHAGKTTSEDPRIGKIWASRNPEQEYSHVRWAHGDIEAQLQNNTQIRLDRIDSYKNDKTLSLWMRCTCCSWFEKVSLIFARNDRCPKCHPAGSNLQNEVLNWIQTLGVVAIGNVSGIIGRQELDIFVPHVGLAIEVNGLYWHNELGGKDMHYHQSKLDKCKALNIHLVHIFEDEWRNKQDIVKSMLINRLNLTSRKISARNCDLVEVNRIDRREFFEMNHIEGDVTSVIAYGLLYKGELVACLSLRQPFHGKRRELFEVARSASKTLTIVRGGVSRLVKVALKYAKDNNRAGLMTYVDRRFGFFGNAYEVAGFVNVGETPPRFWWTDSKKRYNRFKFRADKKRSLSESEVASLSGVVKIWGCSNIIYELR